jgi:hypothetical protein
LASNDFEKISLGSALDQVPEADRFPILIQCLPDAGSRTFVEDIGKVLVDHKWPQPTANCMFSQVRPDLTGLYIGVSPLLKGKKFEEMPKKIQTLAKILNDGHVNWQWALGTEQTKEDDFSLVVGNAP